MGKNDEIDWGLLKPLVYEKLEDFFDSEQPIFTEDPIAEDTKVLEDDSEAVALIKEILETRVRPLVQEDGGDIEFLEFDEEKGIVYLAMKGACTDCPSSSKLDFLADF